MADQAFTITNDGAGNALKAALTSAVNRTSAWVDGYNAINAYLQENPTAAAALGGPTTFWYQNAPQINGNDPTSQSNAFIRTVTATGLAYTNNASSPDVLQQTSNKIAQAVIGDILTTGKIQPVQTLIDNDISVSLANNQTLGGWGGAAYYWNYLAPPAVATQPGQTIGQYIMNNPVELDKFIAANANANVVALGVPSLPATSAGEVTPGVDTALANMNYNAGAGLSLMSKEAVPASIQGEILGRTAAIVLGVSPVGDPGFVNGYSFAGTDTNGHGIWLPYPVPGMPDAASPADAATANQLDSVRAARQSADQAQTLGGNPSLHTDIEVGPGSTTQITQLSSGDLWVTQEQDRGGTPVIVATVNGPQVADPGQIQVSSTIVNPTTDAQSAYPADVVRFDVSSNVNTAINLDGGSSTIHGGDNVSLTVSGAAATINLGDGANFIDDGKGGSVTTGGSSNVTIDNDGVTLVNLGSRCIDAIRGVGDSVSSSSETVSIMGSGSNVTLNGSNNQVSVASGTVLTLRGDANQVTLSSDQADTANVYGSNNVIYNDVSGNTVNLFDGDADTVYGSNGSIGICGTAILAANNENVTLAPNRADTADVFGSNNVVYNDIAGNTVNLFGGDADTVYGSNGSIGIFGTATVAANNETITLSTDQADTANVFGSTNQVENDNAGNTVNLFGGDADTVNGSNGAIGIFGAVTVGANNETITLAAGQADTAELFGSSNQVENDNAGNTVNLFNGDADTVNGSNGSIGIFGAVTVGAINETITLAPGQADTAELFGSSNQVENDNAGNTVNLFNGDADTVNGSNGSIGIYGAVTIGANNETITLAPGQADTAELFGSSNQVENDNAGDTVNLFNGDADTVNGSNGSIGIFGAVTVGAINENITLAPGQADTAELFGSNNQVNNDVAGNTVNLFNGDADTVGGSGGAIGIFGNATVAANNETITLAGGQGGDYAAVNVYGGYDSINAAYGDAITVNGGGDAIHQSSGSLTLNAGGVAGNVADSGTVTGTALTVGANAQANFFANWDSVTAGANAAVALNGVGNTTVQAAPGSVVQTLAGGATDTHVTGSASTPYNSYDDVSGAGIDTQRVTNFADGSHTIEIWDSQGNQPWNKADIIFDQTGSLQFIKTDFNNGSWESTAFTDPRTSSYVDNHTNTVVTGQAAYSEIFNRFGTELGLNLYNSNNQLFAQFGGPSSNGLDSFLQGRASSAGNGQQAVSAFNSDGSGTQGVFGNTASQIGGAFGNPAVGVADTAGRATGVSQASAGGSLAGDGPGGLSGIGWGSNFGSYGNSDGFTGDPAYNGGVVPVLTITAGYPGAYSF